MFDYGFMQQQYFSEFVNELIVIAFELFVRHIFFTLAYGLTFLKFTVYVHLVSFNMDTLLLFL